MVLPAICRRLRWFSVFACCLSWVAPAQQRVLPEAPSLRMMAWQSQPSSTIDPSTRGTISGTVVDQNGDFVVAATVQLARDGQPDFQQVLSGARGNYVLAGVPPGSFSITITATGFATRKVTGNLDAGGVMTMPDVALSIATKITDVQVRVTNYELAEEQVKVEEQQRVLGFIPNFYVTYRPDTLPLRPKQKFELAWKTALDPVTFVASGIFAGVEQARNSYSGYGQGAQGYGKRYGASYADGFVGIMVGGAILPSLLKQDPRYYYKGTGSTRSRVFYALANSVICKGDNGHWQTDYSGILGSLASGGISNFYYPASNRNGARLTFENTLIGIGGSGIGNLFQEFLVRKLTPHAQAKP